MASTLWFRNVVCEVFFDRLVFNIILRFYNLVALIRGAISFEEAAR